ncbi:NUDIX hydrolase [Luteipulveratus flavus]|uniref:NUDIX domain-containing protein n=1 Tax=Luteipulveratus flavus TaxID=3031728 RepID=A0ABT6C9Y1_9MICO|nr:NUDIX domain-containing protein [Luteipulveratus sp. YIM 133296]MDF8265122.1 NUDIX domain-containing protein [Luteipulveratus sp. YIM 133296]
MTSTQPRIRQAVRAIVLDRDRHVLLVHFDWPGLDVPGGFWACPGGGIEEGEQPEDALRRELGEEVGLLDPPIGPAVWRKTHLFSMDGWDGQTDTFHPVVVERFEPRPAMTTEQLAAERVHDIRWWSPNDLRTAGVTFSPRRLPEHLDALDDTGAAGVVEIDPL